MNLNYSYLHMSKPIPGAPGQKFYVGAVYKPGRFTLNVNVQSIFDYIPMKVVQRRKILQP